MQRPMVIPECMHRFCHTCIDDALRLGRKECPTCRTKCVSKRSLRPDIKMEKLIRLFYPDLEHAIHEKDLEAAREAREQHDVNAELYYKALARQQSKKKRKDPFSRLKSLDLEVLTDTGSVDVSVQQVKILLRHAKEDKALEFEIDKNDTGQNIDASVAFEAYVVCEIEIAARDQYWTQVEEEDRMAG
ncbi:hypothetical protein EDD86DRAFT_138449 [Gorgonomyces haynaldii]|nr:hypothetical protein EDD86DRAFT_138449 [Gorgonomyces haynaldii]